MARIATLMQQQRNAVDDMPTDSTGIALHRNSDDDEGEEKGNEDGVGAGKIDHMWQKSPTNPGHTTPAAIGARDDASSGDPSGKEMNNRKKKQHYNSSGGKRFWVQDFALLGFGAAMSWLLQQSGRNSR